MLKFDKVDRRGRKIYSNEYGEKFVPCPDPLTSDKEMISLLGARRFNRSASSTYPLHGDLEKLARREFVSDCPFVELPEEEQLRKAALLLQAVHMRAGKFIQSR